MNDYIPLFYVDVITYPCPKVKWSDQLMDMINWSLAIIPPLYQCMDMKLAQLDQY